VTEAEAVRWQKLDKDPAELEKLLNRYRSAGDELQLLIVTNKLLTGFDAPICHAMYLDKPLRDHTLLQAICRTNRLAPGKSYGLVVDYYGVFDEVAKALDFDPHQVKGVVEGIAQLQDQFVAAMEAALLHFPPDLDRTVLGYEGLMAAQEHLRTNAARDAFAQDYSLLARLWETLSPSPDLDPFADDYRWLTQVYESVRPVDNTGRLVWMALGQKTLEVIHRSIEVERVRDDLEPLMLNAELVGQMADEEGRKKRAYELHTTIAWQLRNKTNDPRFQALGERLERLKERYEQNLLNSIEWLKGMLEVAADLRRAGRETETVIITDAKPALTQLFLEYKLDSTPVVVEQVVAEIDNLVRATRFEDWQHTQVGDRQMRLALRKALRKFQLQKNGELFDRAYEYIRQHY